MFIEEMVSRRLTAALLWLVPLFAGVILFFYEPGKWPLFPVCSFRALTGFYCPGWVLPSTQQLRTKSIRCIPTQSALLSRCRFCFLSVALYQCVMRADR